MLITVYNTFLPITTGQVSHLKNEDILLSFLDTSMILHANLLLCEHCTSFFVTVFFVCFSVFYQCSLHLPVIINVLSYLILHNCIHQQYVFAAQ